MRKVYHSRKTRHIVKFSSLIFTTLLSTVASMAEDGTNKTQVAIPSEDTTPFVYNGSLQTYTIAENNNYSVFGNEHTSAGKYEVTVSLNNTALFEWEDGSVEAKTFSFVIKKSQLEIPAADANKYTYSGEQYSYAIAENENYTVDGNRKTNAGEHKVLVSINDTVNFEWTDATVADKSYDFIINKAKVEIPVADTNKFTYNGAKLIYAITPDIRYNVIGNVQINAGSHTVNVELADNVNYEWEDGTSEAKAYSFEVSKALVELPTAVKDTFAFDGTVKTLDIVKDSRYTADITNETAFQVGTYKRTVSINDTENYMWKDGTSEPKVVTFVIEEGKVKIPVPKVLNYTGSTIPLLPQNAGYTIENGTAIEAGEYEVKLGLIPGYIWEDGTNDTVTLTVKILPILVEKPTINSSEVTYDGTPYSMKIEENPAYTISGASIGKEPGIYSSTITLKPNYAWSDTTTDVLECQLRITRIKVAIPSEDSTIFYYNRKPQTYTIAESSVYSVEGETQTNLGQHDVVVTLNDTVHYEWADTTVESKHYQFNIVECVSFDFDITNTNVNVNPGEDMTIDLNVDGTIQYYKITCSQMPELKDSLIEFNGESSIKIPTLSTAVPGKYPIDVTLVSGSINKTFTVDVTINYPASAIIVCWNDVIAVDQSKVKSTTYQWYKDGELIPGATSQYYSDKDGLCGNYMCEVDGGLTVGPVHLDFGKPLYLTAYGESGKIIASVVGSTTAKVTLMSVGGMLTDSKTAAEKMVFNVKPGVYVLVLEGTDQSVKVVVK